MYLQTRCIINATEIFIEMPANPTAQQLTFSNYKNRNTFKALVGITPSGAACFVSDLYGGNISLTVESGILESSDSIMPDRGFTIEDILPSDVCLNVPPRLNPTRQLTEVERTTTRRIASVWIHVERVIKRIKNYEILHMIPNTLHNSSNQLFCLCHANKFFTSLLSNKANFDNVTGPEKQVLSTQNTTFCVCYHCYVEFLKSYSIKMLLKKEIDITLMSAVGKTANELRILDGGPAPGSPGYQYLATILVANIVIIDIRYNFYILYCKLVFWGEVLWPLGPEGH